MTAKILPELHSVSKIICSSIKKFEERLPITTDRKRRNLVAIDETVVKAVYPAIDVEKNELILMRVYTTRNYLDYKVLCKGSSKILREQA